MKALTKLILLISLAFITSSFSNENNVPNALEHPYTVRLDVDQYFYYYVKWRIIWQNVETSEKETYHLFSFLVYMADNTCDFEDLRNTVKQVLKKNQPDFFEREGYRISFDQGILFNTGLTRSEAKADREKRISDAKNNRNENDRVVIFDFGMDFGCN